MTHSSPDTTLRRASSWTDTLSRPLSNWWCALGWCIATAFFVGIVVALGGPSRGDAGESVYSTLAIAHGGISCAFVPGGSGSLQLSVPTLIAPLYPVLSGALVGLIHLGPSAHFPGTAAFGPHCQHAFVAIDRWTRGNNAITDTLLASYVGWLVLLVGAVSWLRVSGRGRCLWEPLTVIVLAVLPPVWMCLETYFHPQDLIAMGLALATAACARRGRWLAAGILVALAVLSQQFALLVGVPLLVIAPRRSRLPFAAGFVGTVLVASFLLLSFTSLSQLRTVVLGSGLTPGPLQTAIGRLALHGAPLDLAVRGTPLLLSALLAWWAVRRLGLGALEPTPLIALLAVSLGLRLVFDRYLFDYYFMALAVSLFLLDVTAGHIRRSLVAWLLIVSLVFSVSPAALVFFRVGWGSFAWDAVPEAVVILTLGLLVLGVVRRGLTRPDWTWFAVFVVGLVLWRENSDPAHQIPIWLWQLSLVGSGLVLAGRPLLHEIRLSGKNPQIGLVQCHVLVNTGSEDQSGALSTPTSRALPKVKHSET